MAGVEIREGDVQELWLPAMFVSAVLDRATHVGLQESGTAARLDATAQQQELWLPDLFVSDALDDWAPVVAPPGQSGGGERGEGATNGIGLAASVAGVTHITDKTTCPNEMTLGTKQHVQTR